MRARVWCAAALFSAMASGCLAPTRSEALRYVVLPNHDEGRPSPPSPEAARLEQRLAKDETHYPIYGDDPPPEPGEGIGGAGCSAGLIGTQCERGLLSDEPSLEKQQFLGPDGRVFEEENPFTLSAARTEAPGPRSPRRAGRALGSARRHESRGRPASR